VDGSSILWGIGIGMIGSLLATPLWYVLTGAAVGLFSDLPRVSGTWKASYTEPNADGGTDSSVESVTFRQIGRLVWGSAHRMDDDKVKFRYSGRIKRNIVVGTFVQKSEGTAVAGGAFQVKMRDDDEQMLGWAMWTDGDTMRVEASAITFERDA